MPLQTCYDLFSSVQHRKRYFVYKSSIAWTKTCTLKQISLCSTENRKPYRFETWTSEIFGTGLLVWQETERLNACKLNKCSVVLTIWQKYCIIFFFRQDRDPRSDHDSVLSYQAVQQACIVKKHNIKRHFNSHSQSNINISHSPRFNCLTFGTSVDESKS